MLAKYRKDAQAFKDFEPAWDKKNVIYDRFAEELNDWYKKKTYQRMVTETLRIF